MVEKGTITLGQLALLLFSTAWIRGKLGARKAK